MYSFSAQRSAELAGTGPHPAKLYSEADANMVANPEYFPPFLGMVLI